MIAGCHGSWQRSRALEERSRIRGRVQHRGREKQENGCCSLIWAGIEILRIGVVDVEVRLLTKHAW